MSFRAAWKRRLSLAARFGVSLAALWYVSTLIDIAQTIKILRTTDFRYLAWAFSAFLAVNFIMVVRWRFFIRALALTTSFLQLIRYHGIGLFGNLFMPSAIGGDVLKVVGLCQGHNKKERVVASVLLDRLSGFAAIVVVAILAFIFGYHLIEDQTILISIGLMAMGSLGVTLLLFNHFLYAFGCRIFQRFPAVTQRLMQLHEDLGMLKERPLEALKAIGASCLSQTAFIITWYGIALALHQDINILYFFVFVPLICVASSVPSIGGLGAREAGAAYLFTKAGMTSGVAVSLSLISFLFMVLVGLMGGLVYVTTIPSRRV